MKNIFITLLVYTLSLLPTLVYGQNLLPGMEKGFEKISSRVEEIFPAVEVYVIAIQEEQIILERPKEIKLQPATELYLFREGKEFTHPITGIVLGRFEESLGEIRVDEIKESYYLASPVILKPGKEVKRGDKARITSTRIKLALWDVKNNFRQTIDKEIFTQQLILKLESSGRFEVIPPDKLQSALDKLAIKKETSLPDKEQLRQLAENLGIRGIIEVQLKDLENITLLEAKILSPFSGLQITKESVQLQSITKTAQETRPASVTTPSPAVSPKQKVAPGFIVKHKTSTALEEGITKSKKYDFAIRAMGCGDVNADGKKEIVVTDGKQVRILAIVNNNEFNLIWTESDDNHNHMSLEVADINQNGKAEIFVTDYPTNGLKSYALEYDGKNYSQIAEWPHYFLRSLPANVPQEQIRLIGQKRGTNEAFYGDVEVLTWKNNRYEVKESLNLPKKVNIYGFAQADVNNDGKIETVTINDSDRLCVYSNEGEALWKSTDHYGGYELFFYNRPKSAITTVPSYVPGEQVKIKGRIFLQDMNKNGINDIIIVHNIPSTGYFFPNAPGFSKGYVVDLEWDGIGYSKTWETKQMDAYVADFLLEDLDGNGQQELIMALALKGWDKVLTKNEESFILYYTLQSE